MVKHFVAGSTYTVDDKKSLIYGRKVLCVRLNEDGSTLMDWGLDKFSGAARFTVWSADVCHRFVECPSEEWVVLMWKDEHKNSVLVNSEFFTSEQSAINKWVEHPSYIGTKRVK